MILDKKLELADLSAAITASAASTNYITNPGASKNNPIARATHLRIVPKADGTGAGTITFTLEDDTDSGFATDLQTIATSSAIVGTDFNKGDVIDIPLPESFRKYVRGYWTISGTVSAQFWAGLVHIV